MSTNLVFYSITTFRKLYPSLVCIYHSICFIMWKVSLNIKFSLVKKIHILDSITENIFYVKNVYQLQISHMSKELY